MIISTRQVNKNQAAILPAFFTIGMIEASFPLLNHHLNYFLRDEYYLRILSFVGLILLSVSAVLFSRMRTGKNVNMCLALMIIIPGMIISLLSTKSTAILFLGAFFLLAGSLFVKVSGLLILIPQTRQRLVPGKIALVFMVNSFGLLAGMAVISICKVAGWPGDHQLIYLSFVFLLLSIACLYFFSNPYEEENTADETITFNFSRSFLRNLLHKQSQGPAHGGKLMIVRNLLSNKALILMLGGLIVYTGAELCLKEMLPYYFSETFGIRILQMLIPGIGLFMLAFITGRVAGVILLARTGPENIFLFSGILSILGASSLFIGQKYLSLAATVLMGLGTANIFPMLLCIALERITLNRKLLVGMLAGTIPLGAFIPSLMWAMADSVSPGMSLTIPVFCLFYVTWIAIVLVRKI